MPTSTADRYVQTNDTITRNISQTHQMTLCTKGRQIIALNNKHDKQNSIYIYIYILEHLIH